MRSHKAGDRILQSKFYFPDNWKHHSDKGISARLTSQAFQKPK
ncbi:hypothetical protein [Nostoc sp. CMAA1605]|nr:hypothetical protein [Nostoc sp. CMAA1605]